MRTLFSLFLLAVAAHSATLTSITVSPGQAILYATETQQYSATCHYSDHADDDCTLAGGVTWKVDDARQGSITSTGLLTTIAHSVSVSTYVEAIAADGVIFGYSYLYVTTASSVTVSSIDRNAADGGVSAPVGTTFWASARVMLSNGTTVIAGRLVNWTSSDPSVATVDWEGHVTALAAGTTTLTASIRGQTRAAVLSVTAAPSGPFRTWYVRPDGGTRYDSTYNPSGQCDGLHDAAYPGSGTNQACAYSSWKWLWLNGGTSKITGRVWAISGGDTVIMRQNPNGVGNTPSGACSNGSYDCGYDVGYKSYSGAAAGYDSCGGTGATACTNPPIPSGTPTNPTKIYGENWAACSASSAKTGLYGIWSAQAVLSLANTGNVEVRCLSISDRAGCGGAVLPCTAGTNSYSPIGIQLNSTTTNVKLYDIDVHGVSSSGIIGMPGDGIQMTRVRVAGNYSSGLNLDPGGTYIQGGGLRASELLVEWNGCVEQYPVVNTIPFSGCSDQNHAGYGDGVGTSDTGGTWLFDHSTFRYNTQDGLDLVHVTMPGALFSITNSSGYGNMGQQFKLGIADAVVFRNNTVIGNCYRLSAPFPGAPDGYNSVLSNFCRANGTSVGTAINPRAKYLIDNNTWAGPANIFLEVECQDQWGGQSTGDCTVVNGGGLYFRNNIMRGYMKGYGQNVLATAFYLGNGAALGNIFQARSNNVLYNTKYLTCPTGYSSELCVDPLFVNQPSDTAWTAAYDQTLFDSTDLHLTVGSAARGAGVTIAGTTTDHDDVLWSDPRAIGAYEYLASGIVAPVITTSPTLPQAASPVAYTYTLQATSLVAVTWSVTSGNLPPGLTLGASTGTISGTPTADGSYSFTVRAQNVAGHDDVQFALTVTTPPVPPTITTITLPICYVGAACSATLAATGDWPITWTATGLPAGITLSTSGVLSGTPTAAGASNLTATATNNTGYDDQALTLTVRPEPLRLGGRLAVAGAARID